MFLEIEQDAPRATNTTDNSDASLIFGILATFVAIAGIAVAVLQLRHMRRQRVLHIYEL
ncbi:hypothetical protein GQ44DRAFT_700729, partial [Phaeosphaeriaceae sp. PMI808]